MEHLTPAEHDSLVLSAPPMEGGEYLSSEVLENLWEALTEWLKEQVVEVSRLPDFLETRAPKWNQVGRVCFHLAENKQDEGRPFAFLATYSTGFGTTGKLKHLPLRKALEQYAGSRNKPALVKLLTPVQRAAERLPWVAEMVDSGTLYRAVPWPVEQAYQFLRCAPHLEECGLTIKLPNWWKKRPRPRVSVTIGEQKGGVDARALLNFQMEVALGGETLDPEELRQILSGQDGLMFLKGQWVEVDGERLRQAIEHWQKLERKGEVSFVEGMRLLAGASTDLEHDLEEQEREWIHLEAGQAVREILAGLGNPAGLAEADVGEELKATLRPYQKTGLNWLRFLTRLGLGACLADDMGLGKTVQILALLLNEKREVGKIPSLLVVPASLLGNWKSEAERFAPSLKLAFAHPSEMGRDELSKLPSNLAGIDLVITTYSMIFRQSWFAEIDWGLVVLDEAQAIKNPSARQSKAVKSLKSRARVALTGTPVENRLGDLWSIFDFLNPGLLGSSKVFKSFVKNLQSRTENQFAPLRKLISPYILRRLKTDPKVVSDLPEKVEIRSFCTLTKTQVGLYQKALDKMREQLEKSEGMARRGIVLQSLMRLKQVCNHPSQVTGSGEFEPSKSGKFQRLEEICSEISDRQERVLVFTQFREIVEPLAECLSEVFGRSGLVLHGGTAVKKRSEMVERFQAPDGPPFFILSLKAGGTGLNLTRASHVIHFDRWWNPAVENQATDRAFRIGQKKNVLVHKFVTRGTLEERIDEMISQKQKLSDEVLSGEAEVNLTELTDEAIMELVQLDVNRALV
ncbi:MAG: DEAD/DEAH box helicase [Vulcanimicrobiota bacterium]